MSQPLQKETVRSLKIANLVSSIPVPLEGVISLGGHGPRISIFQLINSFIPLIDEELSKGPILGDMRAVGSFKGNTYAKSYGDF